MKTKTCRILTVVLIFQLIVFLACAAWLLYDSRVDRSGWVEKNGVLCYRDFHARPVTGWRTVDAERYYFLEGGVPATGWLEQDGEVRYLSQDGVLQTGWTLIDGRTYYFEDDGAMHTGWLELDGQRYYLPEGAAVTGWQEVDGGRCYFAQDGAMQTGFLDIDGGIYYLDEDGHPLTGDASIGENRYRFSDEGVMYTGWLTEEDGNRRYYNAAGVMATQWQEIDGKRYYFGADGTARTGWYQDGEYSYYFLEDGSAAVGPTRIDGQTHFFTPKGIEVILVNAFHPVPRYYERSLVTVVDWIQVDERCYDALMRMLADCEAAGNEYIFNSGYRSIDAQKEILEARTQEYMAAYELEYDEAREQALETVALPGSSEHHLGLAVDLLGDDAIAWLQEHCWDYGFILRYTEEKQAITGIVDEPWHFRYVGTEVSLDMKDSGLCLEEYLGAAASGR